jgi:hypothetical protein
VVAGAINFQLGNSRRERYDAIEISLRHTFAGKFEWFAGYTRSSSRSNAAVEYSLENPIFGPQGPGPTPWDTPNRFHMWGWAPLPNRVLPPHLRFVTRNTTAAYLVEYRTGFPFGVVDEEGLMVGPPDSRRFPDYFNINLHLERQFRALHYLWAWKSQRGQQCTGYAAVPDVRKRTSPRVQCAFTPVRTQVIGQRRQVSEGGGPPSAHKSVRGQFQ